MGPHFDRTLLCGALDISFPLCAHFWRKTDVTGGAWAGNHRAASRLVRPHHSRQPPMLTEGSAPVLMLLSSRLSLRGAVRVSQGSGKVDLKAVQLSVGMARKAACWPRLRPTEAETPWVQPGSLCFNKPSRQLQWGILRWAPAAFAASSLSTGPHPHAALFLCSRSSFHQHILLTLLSRPALGYPFSSLTPTGSISRHFLSQLFPSTSDVPFLRFCLFF